MKKEYNSLCLISSEIIYFPLRISKHISHNFNRRHESFLNQMLLNMGPHLVFQHRIGYSTTDTCPLCSNRDTNMHCLLECPATNCASRFIILNILSNNGFECNEIGLVNVILSENHEHIYSILSIVNNILQVRNFR